jgi:hypothetical protein
MWSALEAIELRQFDEAERYLSAVLNDPGLSEYLREDPTLLRCFHQASRRLSVGGKAHDGLVLARKTLDLAKSLHQLKGESHYNLAQAYATLAQSDHQFAAQAAGELWWVFAANPANQDRYLRDIAFDPVREQIDTVLRGKPDPTVEHARLIAERATRAH